MMDRDSIKRVKREARYAAAARMRNEEWYGRLLEFIQAVSGIYASDIDKNIMMLGYRKRTKKGEDN